MIENTRHRLRLFFKAKMLRALGKSTRKNSCAGVFFFSELVQVRLRMCGECGEDGTQQISRDRPRDPVPWTLAGHRDTAGHEVYVEVYARNPCVEKGGIPEGSWQFKPTDRSFSVFRRWWVTRLRLSAQVHRLPPGLTPSQTSGWLLTYWKPNPQRETPSSNPFSEKVDVFKRSEILFHHHQHVFHITDKIYQKKKRCPCTASTLR